jgi:hypothetical protein
MAVTKADLTGWLGAKWVLEERAVANADWEKLDWRAEFLCQRVRLRQFFVHEVAQDNNTHLIQFAVRA